MPELQAFIPIPYHFHTETLQITEFSFQNLTASLQMALSAGAVVLSMKTLLIFAGTVSLLMAMRSVLPLLLFDFRMIWGVFMAWLRPPYLYFVINGIILAIVFASRFQHERLEKQLSGQLQPLITVRTPPPAELVAFVQPEYKSVVEESFRAAFGDEPLEELELKPVMVNGRSMEGLNEEKLVEDDAISEEVQEVQNPSLDPPPELETELLPSLAAEKPLVSTRFAHRKPSVRASPEGVRGLRVSRPKKQETLETTWRMITEGRHVPLTRHLRKSDALENQSRHMTAADTVVNPTQPPRNGESPKAAPTHSSRSPWIMRKEPSLSQDELNRRVEAFIKKFNEEMRIQRQQSLQQYMEMINRGAN